MKTGEINNNNWRERYQDVNRSIDFAEYMKNCVRFIAIELPKLEYFAKIKTFADVGGSSGYVA